ncbi:MAG: hypothetical protein AB1899_17100 [Pseudomonadota bacterium]
MGLLLATSPPAQAFDTTWDVSLYAYPEHRSLADSSVLNPGNQIARLAETTYTSEARLNLRLANDDFRLTLRPILTWQQADGADQGTGYLAQALVRLPLSEQTALLAGREVQNWGPAQFRSPASPFYFDNGRSNPLRELTGVDGARLAWTPDRQWGLSLGWNQDRGRDSDADDPWRDAWLLKMDRRGDDWAAGLVLAQARDQNPFAGFHVQKSLDEAWLIYGEVASSTRSNALVSPANPALPFSIADESGRQATGLLGVTRTLENGQSLTLEFLYDGHGFSREQTAALFSRSAANPAAAGMALSHLPPLLNRHYLHAIWQSNFLDGDDYWRLMASHNLDDHSTELAGYGEHAVNGRLSLFALGVWNQGGPRGEFASLLERSLTLGLRLALP